MPTPRHSPSQPPTTSNSHIFTLFIRHAAANHADRRGWRMRFVRHTWVRLSSQESTPRAALGAARRRASPGSPFAHVREGRGRQIRNTVSGASGAVEASSVGRSARRGLGCRKRPKTLPKRAFRRAASFRIKTLGLGRHHEKPVWLVACCAHARSGGPTPP